MVDHRKCLKMKLSKIFISLSIENNKLDIISNKVKNSSNKFSYFITLQ